jgi:hypothetical protein
MIHEISVLQNKNEAMGTPQIVQIDVDFSDEGVPLNGSVKVEGDGIAYVPIFERDMRENHKAMFPVPEPEPMIEEMI